MARMMSNNNNFKLFDKNLIMENSNLLENFLVDASKVENSYSKSVFKSLSQEEITLTTNSYCFELSRIIAEETDLSASIIYFEYFDSHDLLKTKREFLHTGLMLTDELMLDSQGIWRRGDWLYHWWPQSRHRTSETGFMIVELANDEHMQRWQKFSEREQISDKIKVVADKIINELKSM